MQPQENNLDLKGVFYHYTLRNMPIFGVSVATMIHEYGHLICSSILQFHAHIPSKALNMVFPETSPEGVEWFLFYLSGGVFQFIVFWLMSFRASDSGTRISNRMTAIIGLFEGLTEWSFEFRMSGLGAALGIIFAFIYLTYTIIRHKRNNVIFDNATIS